MEFASITKDQLTKLMGLEVDTFVITSEQIKEVRKVLGIDGTKPAELQAVRNSVVRYFSSMTSVAREISDFETYDKLFNVMSGVLAVIDNELLGNC